MKQLAQLHNKLKETPFDALLISSVPNIIYFTDYAGFSTEERDGFLLITKENKYIFTNALYIDAVKKEVPDFTVKQIIREEPFKKLLAECIKKHRIKRLGIEEQNISVAEFMSLKKHFKTEKISVQFSPIETLLSHIRLTKTVDEIEKIKAACALGDKAFAYILTKIKPGITEKELAFYIDMFVTQQNAEPSFRTIVAFGKNAAIPHHLTSNQKLAANEFILMDFGVKKGNYCSDMTRTIFFGIPTSKQKRMYETVKDAQQKAINFLSSTFHLQSSRNKSVKASQVDKVARDYIVSQGFPTIPHSLGHGIGLEVHEAPRISPTSKDILKPGMVFSIEPGIYLPGFGGVRIEDLVVMYEETIEIITKSPKDLIFL